MATPTIRVAAFTEADGPAVAAFYAKVWGGGEGAKSSSVSPEKHCPFPEGMPAPVALVFADEQVAGYLGSIPTQIWDGTRAAGAHWLKGFMVLEEYRNGPIGYLLLKQILTQVGLASVMTVAPVARRLFEAVGFKDIGTVPNYVTIVRPGKVLRSIDIGRLGLGSLPSILKTGVRIAGSRPVSWFAGTAASACLALLDGMNHALSPGLRSQVLLEPPEAGEIDQLWQAMQQRLTTVPSRSGTYIHWRYAGENLGRYEFICVRRDAKLAALAVVRRPERVDDPRLAGLKVGLIVDLVVDPADTAAIKKALLAARGWGHVTGCDAVLLTLSHGGLARLVMGRGYVRIPGNVHFLLRAPAGTIATPKSLEHTWVTRGDAWGDDI